MTTWNDLPKLDSSGYIPVEHIPPSVVGSSTYKGPWSSTTTYSIGDYVTYTDPADHYIKPWISKVNSNLNNEPDTSPAQWEKLLSASPGYNPAYLTGAGTLDPSELPSSVVSVSSPVAFNTPTNCFTINSNGAGLTANTQSTAFEFGMVITNPDAAVRPSALHSRSSARANSAPVGDTDFHGWDIQTILDTTSVTNTHCRIYAFELEAGNWSNATCSDLVSVYGFTTAGSGGSSGGSSGFTRSFQASTNIQNNATVTSWAAFYIRTPNAGFNSAPFGGTITNAYGLYVPTWTQTGITYTNPPYAVWVAAGGGSITTGENIVINNTNSSSPATQKALSVLTDSSKTATAVSIAQQGTGKSFTVQQAGANTAVDISVTSAAAGFWPLTLEGYDYGPLFSTSTGSGDALTVKNGGTGTILNLQNGSGVRLTLLNSGQFKTIAGNEATGAGSAALGANCPAVTATAPYTWEKITTSDGSQGYFPVWK